MKLDHDFLKENMMGPSAVLILEELCKDITLPEGARILDLGCGRGLTSMWLADRYGAQVFATDLWIPATENYERFRAMGLGEQIVPIHADANNLPFADRYFDAVFTVDSYHYFGCGKGFLTEKVAPLTAHGGLIAVAVPGLQQEMGNAPKELEAYWQPDMNFHSGVWWEKLWKSEPSVERISVRDLTCHKQAWTDWLACDNNEYAVGDREMMRVEDGKYFATIGMSARVK